MKSSNGTDGAGRGITTEHFLENDAEARHYAVENGVETAVHVITGRVVFVHLDH